MIIGTKLNITFFVDGDVKNTSIGLFSVFQYGFWSFQSTADLLTVESGRIARAFNRVWHAVILHKRKSYGISGQIYGLIFSFLSNDSFE